MQCVTNNQVEIITAIRPRTRKTAEYATRAEEAGWHGIGILDNQNLCGDIYVSMALAARATERIQLSTDVTNPVTRHPAVTAGAIASIQEASEGRAVLGIGRGDSALAFVGHAPAYVRVLDSYLKALQAYLQGSSVAFDDLTYWRGMAPPVGNLKLAETPADSRLRWLDSRDKKVPVAVAASGPRVIGTAARHADIVMFALGADLGRLGWGLEQARTARREAGLEPDGIRYGAYVNIVCHPQLEAARELGPIPGHIRAVFGNAWKDAWACDTGGAGSPCQSAQRVQHAGPQTYRLFYPRSSSTNLRLSGHRKRALDGSRRSSTWGIDRIVVLGPTVDANEDEQKRCAELLAREVLPAFSG